MTWDTFFNIANWKEVLTSFALLDPIRGLWFIKALIINKFILFLFRKHLNILTIVSLLIFVFFSLGYSPLLNGISHPLHPYFSFYFHTFFCCIGALYANNKLVYRIRVTRLLLLFIAAFIWHLYNYDYAVIAWRIICPFFFMSLFMHFEPAKYVQPIYIFMRKVSILFYFLHFNFLWIYSSILHLEKMIFFDQSIIRFLCVIFCCFLTSLLILILEKRRYFIFLKYSH